jgi:hypothetical protein
MHHQHAGGGRLMVDQGTAAHGLEASRYPAPPQCEAVSNRVYTGFSRVAFRFPAA